MHVHELVTGQIFSKCMNIFFKALILEEIALDSLSKEAKEKNLQEAQELHLQSLALARKAFGENNVQTAKHYGNLGRLYQSMQRYEVCALIKIFLSNTWA